MPEFLPRSLIDDRLVIALGATVFGIDNEAVVRSGNNLLLSLDDLDELDMSAVLAVVLVDGELRDLHQVLIVEVLDRRICSDLPAAAEGGASGGGRDGDEREEEEEASVWHGLIEWSGVG